MKYRFENFGGIVSSDDPPLLAFVDRQFMREIGAGESPLWETDDRSIGLLSAPTEVHLACTNKCSVGCPHCYMDASEPDPGEMDTETFKRALTALSEMGVFHVALGGGEALERDDLFDLADHARKVGLVPNLTTSGLPVSERNAAQMTVFGQVNLSLDGIGPLSAVFRGRDYFSQVDRAIGLLLDAGVATGINCVLGRRNFDGMPELFDYAARKGVNEIELLRFKPAGRAVPLYSRERTTYEQNVALMPQLQELSRQHRLTTKIDCSFIPMLCYHDPPREVLTAMATYGCEAANVLVGARSDGRVSGCSFLPDEGISVFQLKDAWNDHPRLQRLRTWTQRICEPCASCAYLDLCKGGCHAVSASVTGNEDAPDPDCPRVVESNRPSPSVKGCSIHRE